MVDVAELAISAVLSEFFIFVLSIFDHFKTTAIRSSLTFLTSMTE